MATFFLKLLDMSITASWLILAVLGLRLLMKKAPKWQVCLLWSAVGIRLIFPFSIKSSLSLIPSAQTVSPDILYMPKPEIHSGIPAVNSLVNPLIQGPLAATPTASANPLQIWTQVAAMVWLAGLVLLLAYALVSYLRLSRQVKASLQLKKGVWICDDIDTPFILGFMKPRIYLPSGLEKDQLALILAHEEAHLQRRDHWWKPLGFVLLSLYWFNPLSWLAYVLLCRDIEMACDEKVIRTMGKEGRLAYSQTLLASSIPHRAIMACPLAFGEVAVKERIKTILNYKKPAFWIILLALIASIALAIGFLTHPKDPVPTVPTEPSETDPAPDGLVAREWFNYLGKDTHDWPESQEIRLEAFPGVTFRSSPGEMEAITDRGSASLYWGMPIWNTYFCDLTGDGQPELCSTVSMGSGIVDNHVLVYDYQEKTAYILWDRGIYDYDLSLEADRLYVAKRPYREDEVLEKWPLTLEDLSEVTDRDRPIIDLDYQAFVSPVGYSEAGIQVMLAWSGKGDSEGFSGIEEGLIPLVKLDSRADLDAFTRDLSAYFNFDMEDPASAGFSKNPLKHQSLLNPLEYPDLVVFSQKAKDYTDAFFADHSLFVAYLAAATSADRFEMGQVSIEGDRLNLSIRQLQTEVGDAVMTGWCLMVEVEKTAIADCSLYVATIGDRVWPEDVWPGGEDNRVRTYRYAGQSLMDSADLQLFDSGDFVLSLSSLSSYLGYGTYVIEEGHLILKTGDGQYTYVFDQRSDGWSFNRALSSPPFTNLSSLSDGSLFRYKDRGLLDLETLSDWWQLWTPDRGEPGALQLNFYLTHEGVSSKFYQASVTEEAKREDLFQRLTDLEIVEVEYPLEADLKGHRLELQFYDKTNKPLLFLAFQVMESRPGDLYLNGSFLPAEETIPDRTFLVVDEDGWPLFEELMALFG